MIANVRSGVGRWSGIRRRYGLVRHHNPARWLTDDGLGHTSPDGFVQARMAVSAHDDGVDRVRMGKALKHLADRAAVDLHRFEGRVDPMFPQMIDEPSSGLLDRLVPVVRHGD